MKRKDNNDTRRKPVNSRGLAIGAILIFLSAMCLIQTSLTGCSSSQEASPDENQTATEEDVPFYEVDGEEPVMPTSWEEVSDAVFEQISETYAGDGMVFRSIEKSLDTSHAVRITFRSNQNIPPVKQHLDGFLILHNCFPEQDLYVVSIDGEIADIDWDTSEALYTSGYAFDVPPIEAEKYWNRIILGLEPENTPGSSSGSVTTESD